MLQPVRYYHLLVCTFVILSNVARHEWMGLLWALSAVATCVYATWTSYRRARRRRDRRAPKC